MNKILSVLFILLNFNICLAQNPIEQTFQLINQQRRANGLNALEWNGKLEKAAKSQANWMAKTGVMTHTRGKKPNNFFDLINSEYHPVDRIIKSDYYSFDKIYKTQKNSNNVNVKTVDNVNDLWGEIIAHGTPGTGFQKNYPYRADVLVKGWMNSPGHKSQILKPSFREMAVAFSVNSNGDVFWCVVFGRNK